MYIRNTRYKILMLLFYYKMKKLQNKYDQRYNTNGFQISHIYLV